MNADRPIERHSEDLLNRWPLAKHIAEMVFRAPTDHSVVFGISGSWGLGKTSFINMVCEHIDEMSMVYPSSSVLVVRFNPWNYPGDTNFITPFFKLLSSEVQKAHSDNNELKAKVGALVESICDYAEVFESSLVKQLRTIIRIREEKKKLDEERKVPEEIKEEIALQLEASNIRIVVVIDDIDRLPDKKVCSVFQLVAAVADFPRVNYVLAYDINNVAKALRNVQQCDGKQYLEKIVQVPIDLPLLGTGTAIHLLRESLGQVLQGEELSPREQDGLHSILGHVSRVTDTVRDVRRIINVYEIEWRAAQGKIAPDDLLGMTLLRVFYPKMIVWMRDHASELVGEAFGGYVPDEARKKAHQYTGELALILGCAQSEASGVVSLLGDVFPKFANTCGIRAERVLSSQLRLNRRIACHDLLRNYVEGAVESYSFPRVDINRLISSGSIEELQTFLEENKGDSADVLISVVGETTDDIAEKQQENIARALIQSDLESVGHEADLFTLASLGMSCLKKLFRSMGRDKSSYIFEEEVAHLDVKGLTRVAKFINLQELAYGRLAVNGGAKGEKLISLECLEQVESHCVSVLRCKEPEPQLLAYRGGRVLLYLWKSFNPDLYEDKVTNKLLQDPLGYALYASQQLMISHSSRGAGWAPPDEFSDDIDLQRLSHCCLEVPTMVGFWVLDEATQRRVAALSICVERLSAGAEYFDAAWVLEREAAARFNQWREGDRQLD